MFDAASELVAYYDRMLSALASAGYRFSAARVVVKFKDEGRAEAFRRGTTRLLPGLRSLELVVETDPEENWSYYASLRMRLYLSRDGREHFLADGGDLDWTQKTLNDRKERFFASGLGSERLLDKRALKAGCPSCGAAIEKIQYLGGSSYFCPLCQGPAKR
jgi:hypothetical protein